MLSWLKSLLPQSKKRKVDPRDPAHVLGIPGGAHLTWPLAQTDNRVEQVRHFVQWVYIAADIRARTLAASPPNVSWVRTPQSPGTKSRYLPTPTRAKALTPLLAHEELEPVPDNHPLVRLLRDPNEPDTSYDLWYETSLYLDLCGITYWHLPRNKVGLPEAIWVLPSHWVWPILGKDKLIEGYSLRPTEGNYLRRDIPAEEVLVFKRKNPVSKIDGYAPLTAGNQWVDISQSVNRARWWSYRNGIFPSVAVQFDGSVLDPSEGDLRRIEQKLLARQAGDTRANAPIFLPPGVSLVPLSFKPNQMIFGETAEEMAENILALYKVPLIIAGKMKGLTSAALRAANAGFHQLSINPDRRYYSEVLTETFSPLYGGNLRLWWEDSTPADPDVLEQQIKTDLLACAITPNEVRALRGRQPLPFDWADLPIKPVNMESGTLPGGGAHDGNPAPGSNPGQPTLNDDDYKSYLHSFSRNGTHV